MPQKESGYLFQFPPRRAPVGSLQRRPPRVVLTADAFPDGLELSVGDTRNVALPTAAGGYRWQAESSAPRVASAEISFERDVGRRSGTYTAGQVLTIAARDTGATVITVTQRRSWEPAAPLASHRIVVTVTPLSDRKEAR